MAAPKGKGGLALLLGMGKPSSSSKGEKGGEAMPEESEYEECMSRLDALEARLDALEGGGEPDEDDV